MSKTVRIRPYAGTASGRREGWLKVVTAVDESVVNGYAFHGDFLKSGVEVDLEVGSVILKVDPKGSVKNGWKSGHVLILESDGSLTEISESNLHWRNDFLTIRDTVVKALNKDSDGSDDGEDPLAEFSNEEILNEAKKRNLF